LGKVVKTIVNFRTAGLLNPAEITFEVSDGIENATIDWTQRNFEETTLEIWTGPGSTGTQLILNTDYSLSLKNDFVSAKSALEIYSGVQITNVTYQSVSLYIPINTLNMFGDIIDESDLNRIVPSYDVYTITTGSNQVHALPDATLDVGEQTIKRYGAGSGKVTFTTESGQTIEGISASTWELEAIGKIVLFPSGGNWEVKIYSDRGSNGNGNWKKLADGDLEQDGISTSTLATNTQALPYTAIAAPKVWGIYSIAARMVAIFTLTVSSFQFNVTAHDGSNDTSGNNMPWHSLGRWRT